MAEFKLTISDPKTGKSYQQEVKDMDANAFLGKVIGGAVKGDDCGFAGYEFLITGGSDSSGFPMRSDLPGTKRKKIFTTAGVGVKIKKKGERRRKTVRGNSIDNNIVQINLKITKAGKKAFEAKPETKVSGESETSSQTAPKEGEAPKEKAEEKPKEEKKAEEKPKEEPKKEEPAKEKAEEKPKEEKKAEEKPKEEPKKEEPAKEEKK